MSVVQYHGNGDFYIKTITIDQRHLISDLLIFAAEIVVVGTGEKLFRLDPKLQRSMREQHNILLEVQDSVSCVFWFYSV